MYSVENFTRKILCSRIIPLRPIFQEICVENRIWRLKCGTKTFARLVEGGTFNMLLQAPNLTLFRQEPLLTPKC